MLFNLFQSNEKKCQGRINKIKNNLAKDFGFSKELSDNWNDLEKDRETAEGKREKFLEANGETEIQSVSIAGKQMSSGSVYIKIGAIFIESLLAYQGFTLMLSKTLSLQPSPLGVLIIALLFSWGIIELAIMIRTWVEYSKNELKNELMYYIILVCSYLPLLILPVFNLQIHLSHPDIMTLLLVILTFIINAAIVSMFRRFENARIHNQAIVELKKLDNNCDKIQKKQRKVNMRFRRLRTNIGKKAHEMLDALNDYNRLDSTQLPVVMLSNEYLWILNNHFYRHRVLPYLTENGQIILDFDPNWSTPLMQFWNQVISTPIRSSGNSAIGNNKQTTDQLGEQFNSGIQPPEPVVPENPGQNGGIVPPIGDILNNVDNEDKYV